LALVLMPMRLDPTTVKVDLPAGAIIGFLTPAD
jgi:hypothetical protein